MPDWEAGTCAPVQVRLGSPPPSAATPPTGRATTAAAASAAPGRRRSLLARRTEVDGGLRLRFDERAPIDDLARLVQAERSCCGFFAFALTVDGRGLALEVRAPSGARGVVEALFGPAGR